MKIYIVSLESTHTNGATAYQQKAFSVQKAFASREEADRFIQDKIDLTEKMCREAPSIHTGFSREVRSCEWVDTFTLDWISTIQQHILTEFTITELDI